MLSQFKDEVSYVEPLEIQQSFVNLGDETSDLLVTERFFESLERRYLKEPREEFDRSRIKANLRILEGFAGEIHRDKFTRLVNEIREGIRAWQTELLDRDSRLEAYHLRRYCDDRNHKIEPIVYSALTRFYRSTDGSPSGQSKFDLVVTRLFSRSTDPPFRSMLIEREDLEDQIEALFEGWDHGEPIRRSAHASLVIAKLDDFRREAEALAEYKQILKSDIFERLRSFKRKLGDLYFEPSIAAAAVECNITIGNAFNRLLAESNKKVSEKLSEGEDIAGAFYDASPEAETRLKDVLSELRTPADSGEMAEESASVNELLELVCEGADPWVTSEASREATPPPRADDDRMHEAGASAPTAQKRLEPLFFTLSQPDPNHAILRDHMRKYPSIDQIDLRDFIGRPEDPTDHLCRNVLGVILWVEELCEHELNAKGEMSSSLKQELHRLLRKSEEFSEQLDYLIRENASESQNKLLIVSNKLLEARLRLKRGIARFTRRSLAPEPAEIVQEAASAPEKTPEAPRKQFRLIDVKSGRANRWLLAATLLVSVVCGLIYFFDQQMTSVIPATAKDVEKLDVKRLPGGEHLQQAYRRADLLFITAKSDWAMLSESEQTEKLSQLLAYPSKTKVTTVMITDGMGRILGEISPEGTKLLGKVQVADAEHKKPDDVPEQEDQENN